MIQTLIAMLMIPSMLAVRYLFTFFLLLVYVFCLVTMRSDDHVDVRDIIFQIDFRYGMESKRSIKSLQIGLCLRMDRESGEMRFCIFQHDLHQFLAVAMGAFAFRNQNTSDAHS